MASPNEFTDLRKQLLKMERKDLIQYMINKGNEQKEQDHQLMKYLEQDKQMLEIMSQKIRERISQKQAKLSHFQNECNQYENEIKRFDIGLEAKKQKIAQRKDQFNKGMEFVKKQREELKGIVKLITKKLVQNLYNLLLNKRQDQIIQMIEAMIGLVRNTIVVTNEDVELYLRNYDGLIHKLTKTDPALISEEVANRHFDTLQKMNKFFTDEQTPNFKECQPYTAFLAWSLQFYFLTQHARNTFKIEKQIKNLEKEIYEMEQRKIQAELILEKFNSQDYIGLFKNEIQNDILRTQNFMNIKEELDIHVNQMEQQYYNFDKQFFMELEQNVINKKKQLQQASPKKY